MAHNESLIKLIISTTGTAVYSLLNLLYYYSSGQCMFLDPVFFCLLVPYYVYVVASDGQHIITTIF